MDHCVKKKRKRDPRDRAGIISTVTFYYTLNLFRRAFKKEFNEDDLYQATKSCSSESCGKSLELLWNNRKKTDKCVNAFTLLWRHFGKNYLLIGVLDLIFHVFYTTLQPSAVSNLISHFSTDTTITKQDAYYYAGQLLGLNLVRLLFRHNYSLFALKYALKVRTSFTALLYRKILKLSYSALNDISLGNVVTIVTKDVASFENNVHVINDMVTGSLECAYVGILVYVKMGPTALVGIGLMVLVLPLQAYLAKLVAERRLEMSKKTDQRLQTMQETLSAMKTIKMCAWEKCFEGKVAEARKRELQLMIKTFYIQMAVYLIGVLTSRMAFFVSILAYIYLGYAATAEFVYYVLACFDSINELLAVAIPYGWSCAAQMYAALIRLSFVLNAEEICEENCNDVNQGSIEIKNVTVTINNVSVLKDISFEAKEGLIVITGSVGSGKSVLLKTILNEYRIEQGSLNIKGSISYASQDPWLFPSTIKQNILFGEPFNEQRYNKVISVCALDHDFDLFDYGENTIVSDKGMNLSKGQQARINLARAIYKKSGIYLLDDPLAALDGNIQSYIFTICIKGFLKDKLCVLVSQSNDHLEKADKIICIEEGRLLTRDQKRKSTSDDQYAASKLLDIQTDKLTSTESEVYKEVKIEGAVALNLYFRYFRLGGGLLLLSAVAILCTCSQASSSYISTLLSDWVDLNQKVLDYSNHTKSLKYTENQRKTNLTINLYMGMIGLWILLELFSSYTHLTFVKKSSLKIHKKMATSVINAVMSFCDCTFIGNILNRFSQDLSTIDEELPFMLVHVTKAVIEVCAIIFVITTINWRFLPSSAAFIIFTIILRLFYMPMGRSLKRLESTTRSPLIGHLNSSLEGLISIRSFKKQKLLIEEFDRHQDLFTSARFMSIYTFHAFGFLVDAGCILLLSFIVIRFLYFETDISAGSVGLALSQVILLSQSIQWAIKYLSRLENQMTSLERVLEYTNIKQETKTGETKNDWPKYGAVKFENVWLSYSKNENILKDVTFSVEAKQKIGIVGRTGAGKSSIISTLFRLYEIQGNIFIDDVNINNLSLECIRKNIAIIPQDPILFTGTMRFNIDPTNAYTDEEIWKAIKRVKLKNLIDSLDIEITGKFYSAGQKQLICLARAIILMSKIVVLDEASANMDPKTEQLLQQVIKENFSKCTLFVIAHRLHSVIDSDKILVVSNGELVEFDTPRELLKNINGYFYNMMGNCQKDI